MPATRDDVVRAAVQLERDGRAFYLDAAEKAASELTRKMFASLAADEVDHIAWIEKMMPDVDTATDANRDLYGRLSHIFAEVPDEERQKIVGSDDDVAAIHAALAIEKKAVDAYDKWQEEADELDVKKLCNLLTGVERFHIQVLQNTLEYLERPADWFMQEEQWNFEGA